MEVVSLLVDYHRLLYGVVRLFCFQHLRGGVFRHVQDIMNSLALHKSIRVLVLDQKHMADCSTISSYCALAEIRPVYESLSSCSWFRPWRTRAIKVHVSVKRVGLFCE